MTLALQALRLAADPCTVMEASGLAPDDWQAALLQRQPSRALVCCSRQVGKTETVAALAVHRGLVTGGDIVTVAPSQRQAGELIRRAATHLRALGVPAVRSAATSLGLPGGGRILALPGTADSVRGYAPMLVVVDEAAYLHADTYEACRPMLAATGGDLIAMSTPAGQSGWFYEAWEHGGDAWHRTRVPWHDCSRISVAFINEERAALPAARFAAEYECDFIGGGSGVFDPALIERAFSAEGLDLPAITPYHAKAAV